MLTKRPRGTNDFMPEETVFWRTLEQTVHQICSEYGYHELRTPIFEHTELFLRGVGETTDIVEKEMYSFTDRGDRSITLRPEGTAPTVRAFLEHKLYGNAQPTKFYYIGPMFRYGRPQAGRFRQFHQFGIEVFGSKDAAVDAEVITLAMDFFQRLGLTGLALHINSVGCPSCRETHKERLLAFLETKIGELCETCRGRREKNPLRIFDCKSSDCQDAIKGAPTIAENLCPDCAGHFEQVQNYLTAINIPFIVDETMVRGLDYYTNTAFEIMVEGIGAQSSIAGGGRYDGLVEQCGGPSTPGIGFGLGLERIITTMKQQGVAGVSGVNLDVYLITLGEIGKEQAFKILQQLRSRHVKADQDVMGRSLKAQMKQADKLGAEYVLIIGTEEVEKRIALLRNMASGDQEEVSFNRIAQYIAEKVSGRKE